MLLSLVFTLKGGAHTFLVDPQSDLRDLNGDQTPFTAVVCSSN